MNKCSLDQAIIMWHIIILWLHNGMQLVVRKLENTVLVVFARKQLKLDTDYKALILRRLCKYVNNENVMMIRNT